MTEDILHNIIVLCSHYYSLILPIFHFSLRDTYNMPDMWLGWHVACIGTAATAMDDTGLHWHSFSYRRVQQSKSNNMQGSDNIQVHLVFFSTQLYKQPPTQISPDTVNGPHFEYAGQGAPFCCFYDGNTTLQNQQQHDLKHGTIYATGTKFPNKYFFWSSLGTW